MSFLLGTSFRLLLVHFSDLLTKPPIYALCNLKIHHHRCLNLANQPATYNPFVSDLVTQLPIGPHLMNNNLRERPMEGKEVQFDEAVGGSSTENSLCKDVS